ncbi:glycine zipper domain-containing protein [Pelagicoccus enzymogenes]|uniref:glycine zipper domain-containing protein n=1 Tax=Pelagicoccus enzymogenes TaxID=2773457 RepID=UPI002811067A|nr:glycine zipper domain-containing protein [Pelagicoccus enzymogenes]
MATRSVVIEGEAGYLGRTSGAIMGSAIGQTAGDGTGRTLAAAGGAVVGGIVGGMVEKELSKKQAQELTVDLDDGHTVVVVQETKDIGFVEGDRVSVTHTPSGEAHVAHAHYETDGIY